MDLSGQRVAVTGAGGFIGLALCRALVAAGAEVVGVDRDSGATGRIEETGAVARLADVTDAAAVAAAVADATRVVHTAALITDYGPMEDFVAVNVRGTRNVMDAAEAAGAERVVHLSSVAGWGFEYRRELSEDAEPRPCGAPYVDTKGSSDRLAHARGATIVRPGDVYGPGSVPWARRPVEAMRARRFAIPAPGDGLMTLVYVDDLVDGILLALTAEAAAGGVFVLWDGEPVTTRDFFGHYARMLGRSSVPVVPRPLLAAGVAVDGLAARVSGRPPTGSAWALRYLSRRHAYDNTRTREVLGWAPKVFLAEGMERTRAWLTAEGLLD